MADGHHLAGTSCSSRVCWLVPNCRFTGRGRPCCCYHLCCKRFTHVAHMSLGAILRPIRDAIHGEQSGSQFQTRPRYFHHPAQRVRLQGLQNAACAAMRKRQVCYGAQGRSQCLSQSTAQRGKPGDGDLVQRGSAARVSSSQGGTCTDIGGLGALKRR